MEILNHNTCTIIICKMNFVYGDQVKLKWSRVHWKSKELSKSSGCLNKMEWKH